MPTSLVEMQETELDVPAAISIRGDTLSFNPKLTPKLKPGLEIRLSFQISAGEDGSPGYLTPEITIADRDEDGELNFNLAKVVGCIGDTVLHGHDFGTLRGQKMQTPLKDIASSMLGYPDCFTVKDFFLQETLRALQHAFSITARIDHTGAPANFGANVYIYLERHGVKLFEFWFSVKPKQAGNLFET